LAAYTEDETAGGRILIQNGDGCCAVLQDCATPLAYARRRLVQSPYERAVASAAPGKPIVRVADTTSMARARRAIMAASIGHHGRDLRENLRAVQVRV
jgi:hypothetical protein